METNFGQEVLETLRDLVRINSINPNYQGGVPELQLADYVQEFFGKRSIQTERHEVFPERPNLIACVPGHDRSRRIIFEAHMDTVGVSGMESDPWEGEIRDGRLYGRGACDTKGGMAAMMHALASLAEKKQVPACDVWFAATIDEEFSYRGAFTLCNDPPLHAEAAIIAEPTMLEPVIASKGLVRWKMETRGKAAHSAKPHLGVNAIEHMAHVILALENDSRELAKIQHPLLGPATCNIGIVRGGTQINFVPDCCEIEIDRRMLPGETVDAVLAHYQELLDRLATQQPGLNCNMLEPMLTDLPLQTDSACNAVHTMVDVLDSLHLESELVGVPFCSDASKFGARGIPSMILGPGSIDQAHAAVEYIDCRQVLAAAEIYRRYMLAFK